MSAGLAASTVTPGRTAPDVSRTMPARVCADARLDARRHRTAARNSDFMSVVIARAVIGHATAAGNTAFAVVRRRCAAATVGARWHTDTHSRFLWFSPAVS